MRFESDGDESDIDDNVPKHHDQPAPDIKPEWDPGRKDDWGAAHQWKIQGDGPSTHGWYRRGGPPDAVTVQTFTDEDLNDT